jgi:hypothetical protein
LRLKKGRRHPLQDIIGIGELRERAIHIWQRQGRKAAKPVRPPLNQACREFVAAPRQPAGACIVSHMNARRRDRRDRNIDPGIIHERQGARFVPRRWCDAANGIRIVVGLAPEKIRKDMVMNIDGDWHVVRYPP